MKKFAMTLLALLACATSGVQAQYSTYYKDMPVEVRQVEPFAIADRSVNLAERGATGDGATLNTDIIQKAIDELSQAGGGHLVIPQGVWLTGPIELKSGVDLHLERYELSHVLLQIGRIFFHDLLQGLALDEVGDDAPVVILGHSYAVDFWNGQTGLLDSGLGLLL